MSEVPMPPLCLLTHSVMAGRPLSPLVTPERIVAFTAATPADYFQLAELPAWQPPINLAATSTCLPQLGILLQKKLPKFV